MQIFQTQMKKLNSIMKITTLFPKLHDKSKQPIMMKKLQLGVLKKLNDTMLHNILLTDDFPYENCHNHWSQAIQPPIFKFELDLDDKYLLSHFLEWSRCLVASNIDVKKLLRTPSHLGNPH